jgi:enamine deaminase RidA (YjgF/YER057c/UK114 family)
MTEIEPVVTRALIRPAYGYCEVLRHGDLIFVSGLIGRIPPDGALADGIEAQTRAIFQLLRERLALVGATLDDVVELVSYHLDLADFTAVAAAKAEFFHPDRPPTWTAVAVSALVDPQALLEIKATAIVGHRPTGE